MAEARQVLDGRYPMLDNLHRALRGELSVEDVLALPPQEQRDLLTLIQYEAQHRESQRAARSPANRRALGLLGSFLNDQQRRDLRKSRYFHVRGSAGGTYRLCIRTGVVQRIERHGRRWYWMVTFCLHDYADDAPDKKRLPLADLALQHMLLLLADEPAFLAAANVSTSAGRLWDREWLQTLRQARAEREAA